MTFWTYGGPTTAEPVAVVDPAAVKTEVKNAYDRGRLDERSRHRGGFGLLGFLLLIAAVLGIGFIALAMYEGSFSAAGAAIDAKFAQTSGQVAPAVNSVASSTDAAVNTAAANTGAALEDAGQSLKEHGAALKRQTPPAAPAKP